MTQKTVKIVLSGRPVLIACQREDDSIEVTLDVTSYGEPGVWGILIADLVEHVASAYEQNGWNREQVLSAVRTLVLKEMAHPTDKIISKEAN